MSNNPPLEEVKLIRTDLQGIPAPIAHLPGLKRVDLSDNQLAGELYKWPWLDNLEELCLMHNDFAQLPTGLLQCKGKLQKLNMLNNRIGETGEVDEQTRSIYQELVAAGTEVLLDNRSAHNS